MGRSVFFHPFFCWAWFLELSVRFLFTLAAFVIFAYKGLIALFDWFYSSERNYPQWGETDLL